MRSREECVEHSKAFCLKFTELCVKRKKLILIHIVFKDWNILKKRKLLINLATAIRNRIQNLGSK